MSAARGPAPASRVALLDDGALASFRRDGYMVLRGFLDPDAMDRVEAWSDELVALPELPGRHMVYYEDRVDRPGERVLSRIENFCAFHPGFDGLLRGSSLVEAATALLDGPAVLFKDKINYKMPGGQGFRAHQDVQAGWDRYASLHLTMLLSIDDATPENGCLELAPGRHREGLLGSMWEPLDDRDGRIEYRSCPTRRRDVVFFDSYVPHRSAPNRTAEPRRVLYVTYNRIAEGDHRARYYADKRRSFPPDCEREPGREYVFRV
jgi:2-aminoethylphosphonate dioxygenase